MGNPSIGCLFINFKQIQPHPYSYIDNIILHIPVNKGVERINK